MNRYNITKNICILNTHSGIAAWWGSNYNNIRDNTGLNNGLGVELVWNSNYNKVINNTFNLIGHYAIQVYRAHNNSILNNLVSTKHGSGYYRGINLDEGSSYNTIKGNDVMGNEYGICFWTASDSIRSNIIIYNNISNNNYGIRFHSGNIHDTIFYLNNFIDNTNNFYSSGSGDTWNSTSKITYTYNGNQYTNYLGNYWSDYTGSDADGDGIEDTPYSIDGDKDYYPLMMPFENYIIAPEVAIFDTGSPLDPYPSISGTHNGTIKPNQTITVSTLYTYPCPGTGGHTEYARIWNSTLDVNATWNGYVDDWHNISFNEPFTLVKDEVYNYTIRTGSYPQIIHARSKPVTGGLINCTKFIDANGKVYYDWIPAIKLS